MVPAALDGAASVQNHLWEGAGGGQEEILLLFMQDGEQEGKGQAEPL